MARDSSSASKSLALVARAERMPSHYVSAITGPTVPPFRSRIRNISTSGMLIDGPAQISIGDVISASIPGNGDVLGTIVRKKDGTAGVKFIQELDLAAFLEHAPPD
jgi:hypothetical protein